MPYITDEKRKSLSFLVDKILTYPAKDSGELNYLVTNLLKSYLIYKGNNYQTYNDIIGALEGAKLELYRKKISFYEDQKEKENGTV